MPRKAATTKTTSTETQEVSVQVEQKVEKTIDVTKKKFADTDLIPCASITAGTLVMTGGRSLNSYVWANFGDVIDVEYRDIKYAMMSKSPLIFKPRFIIQDDDFVSQNKEIQELYNGIYSPFEIQNILNLSEREMEVKVNTLPTGAKDALKGIAINAVNDGTLDSINKIKILDSVFGTEMLKSLAK